MTDEANSDIPQFNAAIRDAADKHISYLGDSPSNPRGTRPRGTPPPPPKRADFGDPVTGTDWAKARAEFRREMEREMCIVRTTNTDVFSLSGGDVVRVAWPETIDPADWPDLEAYLQLLRRKLAKAAGQGRTTDAR